MQSPEQVVPQAPHPRPQVPEQELPQPVHFTEQEAPQLSQEAGEPGDNDPPLVAPHPLEQLSPQFPRQPEPHVLEQKPVHKFLQP